MDLRDNIKIESIEGCTSSNELRITGVISPSIDYTPFNLFARIPKKELPKRYIINKGATILFWDEDEEEKTIVKRSKDDKFNKRLGFLTAYFQYHSGLSKTQANKYLDNLEVEEKIR